MTLATILRRLAPHRRLRSIYSSGQSHIYAGGFEMKTLVAILAAALLAGCAAPSFDPKRPPPSLFQSPLPSDSYSAHLPPLAN